MLEDIYKSIREINLNCMKSSLDVSLKRSLSKISYDDLFYDLRNVVNNLGFVDVPIETFRVKSLHSCNLKYRKNIVKGNSIKSTFNDLLGIRIIVQNYDFDYPEDFRIVDMSKGKSNDDGYRGVHLYYSYDNYHYPIEIQTNTLSDRLFADWSHKHCYKNLDDTSIRHLRKLYDLKEIVTEEMFREEVEKLCVKKN